MNHIPKIGQTVYLQDNVFPLIVKQVDFKDNDFLISVVCPESKPTEPWKFTPDVLRAA